MVIVKNRGAGALTLILGISLLTACGADESGTPFPLGPTSVTDSVASHCGVPSEAKLKAIHDQFDVQFKDFGLLEAVEYRIDNNRSVVTAVVKRPTMPIEVAPTSWLLSGETIEEQLTPGVNLDYPQGGKVGGRAYPNGPGREQWEYDWEECDSIIPNDQRTRWEPPRDSSIYDPPPKCDDAEPLDKVPGKQPVKLHDGLKLIDIYGSNHDVSGGGRVIGGNVVDQSGKVVATGALWMEGFRWRSLNQAALDTSDYRKASMFSTYYEAMDTVAKCIAAVPH